MSDVKLPSRKSNVIDLPKRPKDRNAKVKEKVNEKLREREAMKGADINLQQVKMQNDLKAKMDTMSDEQKTTLLVYAEASARATKTLAKVKYGPTATDEMGALEIDQLMLNITDVIMQASKEQFKVDEFFAMLGAVAGYQAGLAMGKNGKEMTDGMVKNATMIFEGGLRLISDQTRKVYKDTKVVRPSNKIIT